MKKLTAMQELIEWHKAETDRLRECDDFLTSYQVIDRAIELLEKEKQQLHDSFIAGRDLNKEAKKDETLPRTLPSMRKYKFFDDYFTKTFK